MAETFSARYEQGVLIPLQNPGLQERQAVRLQIVPPHVTVSAAEAVRRVNRFLLDHVSYLMGAERPTLVAAEHLLWRVPIVLTYPTRGTIGQAGILDVDAETGELLTTSETANELTDHARQLAAGSPSNPTAIR